MAQLIQFFQHHASGRRAMNNTALVNNSVPQRKAPIDRSPLAGGTMPGNRLRANETNHYAVVELNAAGEELRGWDFKCLQAASTFAQSLRKRELAVEIWGRMRNAQTLARHVLGSDGEA